MLRERPNNFAINRSHALARGLVFAGLGRAPGSVSYRDSAPYGNHGTLTNMDLPTDWVWISKLRRWGFETNGIDSEMNIALPGNIQYVDMWTLSFWCKCIVTTTQMGMLNWLVGSDQILYIITRVANNGFCCNRNENSIYSSGCPSSLDIENLLPLMAHIVITCSGGDVRCGIYVNGINVGVDFSTAGSRAGNADTLSFGEGNIYIDRLAATFSDILIHRRILSVGEIQQLADPSNVMLSGLIEPPRRKYYVIKSTSTSYRYKIGRLLLRRV